MVSYEDTAKALSAIGRNINQIAKRLNAEGETYEADIQEIKESLDEIWQLPAAVPPPLPAPEPVPWFPSAACGC